MKGTERVQSFDFYETQHTKKTTYHWCYDMPQLTTPTCKKGQRNLQAYKSTSKESLAKAQSYAQIDL